MRPRVIGIRFADNDFYFTFITFLEIVRDHGLGAYCRSGTGDDDMTKADIVELCNRSLPGIYWVSQHRLRRTDSGCNPSEYLRIEEKDVLFDDEVTQYITDHDGWDNGEFFVLDTTEASSSQVYCI